MSRRSKQSKDHHDDAEPADSIDPTEIADPGEQAEALDIEAPDIKADNDAHVFDLDAGPEDSLVFELERRLGEMETEVAEYRDKYQRALADFQNFQRRSQTNERNAREQGVRDVLESLLGVLDHFELAIAQDISTVTTEQLVSGVGVIKSELLRALQAHGVGLISPEPGDEFDPNTHEAVVHQAVEGVRPGCVSMTLQAGYTIRDRVVRPAKVGVAPGPLADEPADDTADELEQNED